MVLDKIREMVAEQFLLDVESVTAETAFVDDLNADSLDVVELISALEDEYDLVITDEHIRELYTVKDVAEFIENLL